MVDKETGKFTHLPGNCIICIASSGIGRDTYVRRSYDPQAIYSLTTMTGDVAARTTLSVTLPMRCFMIPFRP